MKDKEILKLLKQRLKHVDKLHGKHYNSPEELLGVLTEEYDEFKHEHHLCKGELTSLAVDELLDIAVTCIKGVRTYREEQ